VRGEGVALGARLRVAAKQVDAHALALRRGALRRWRALSGNGLSGNGRFQPVAAGGEQSEAGRHRGDEAAPQQHLAPGRHQRPPEARIAAAVDGACRCKGQRDFRVDHAVADLLALQGDAFERERGNLVQHAGDEAPDLRVAAADRQQDAVIGEAEDLVVGHPVAALGELELLALGDRVKRAQPLRRGFERREKADEAVDVVAREGGGCGRPRALFDVARAQLQRRQLAARRAHRRKMEHRSAGEQRRPSRHPSEPVHERAQRINERGGAHGEPGGAHGVATHDAVTTKRTGFSGTCDITSWLSSMTRCSDCAACSRLT
jgi:hypothetical protein